MVTAIETANTTNALLEAVCARILEWLPDLGECAVHDGRFSATEVARWAVKAPAVRVSSLGIVEVGDSGDEQCEPVHQLASVVITRETAGLPRGMAARNIVDRLISGIPRERWGLGGVGAATNLRADNLYSGSLDKKGVALWGVLWRQTLRLGRPVDEDCPLPSQLYLGVAPEIGRDHEPDYRRVDVPEGGV